MAKKKANSQVNVATVIIVATFIAVAIVVGLIHMSRHHQPSPVNIDHKEYPVTGLDISSHNGVVDFQRLAADSIDFVVLKATEGATFKDPRFQTNYRAAREAGIPAIGVYHFFKFNTDGKMQGINLLNSVRGKTLELPLVIDLEDWTNPGEMATDSVVVRLRAMIEYLESNGHAVMLYTNKDGYERFLRGRFIDYPLWICSFTTPPLPSDADMEWSIWQYSHWGWTPGVDGDVDLNTFNGTRDQWRQWLRTAVF